MALFERLAALEREGGSAVLATVIQTRGSVPRREGTKMLIYADGRIEGTIGGGRMEATVIEEAMLALKDGKTRVKSYAFVDPEKGDVGVCGGEMEVFIEPLRPSPMVVVIGGGHVGKAVAHLAHWLGFRVVVSDDRPEFVTPEAVPDADEYILCALGDLPDKISIHEETYLILATRGVDIDVLGLPALLETPATYIGVIGSRRRWETTADKLQEMGISVEKLQRVTSPIGLELNAETPEEIAVSVMAQIVMMRRGGSGETMAHAPKRRKGKAK
ncbi:MAG: dehydrogenase [Anaerolineales bacterium]|nr:dehydrogenase [Anaerolineales bacterium]